ncbi:MAG: aminoacyl-tRNA hydrolase [candidate division Zixibacteria bacterium]|nr:aminoacyl-tRNA hydrolase [candidate division Zixibacteria bacterium]
MEIKLVYIPLNDMVSLIIGLGNIGAKYKNSRHNFGFDLLNLLADRWQAKPEPGQGDYYITEKEFEGHLIRLAWPTTYMNNSGLAAAQIMADYHLSANDLLIVHDDFNLPLGKIRLRADGSDGGHNGMASIIYHLGTEKVPRLRMGIGPVPNGVDPVVFVLNRFEENELEIKQKMLDKAREGILYWFRNDAEKAMSLYNQDPAPDEASSGAV